MTEILAWIKDAVNLYFLIVVIVSIASALVERIWGDSDKDEEDSDAL